MSIAQFIQYNQITFLNEFWNTLRQESQLFYDRGNEFFIFRELNQIFVISKSTLNKVTRIKIPYNGPILSLNISNEYQFVAYQTTSNHLNIFSTRANRQFFYQVSTEKNSEIIQFEWSKGSQGVFDLFVVENYGIHLLKIDDQVKKIKFFQQKITCSWYEPKNEVLAICSNQHNGLISTYFFKDKKKDLKFKGPDFYLEDFEQKEGTSVLSSFFKQKKTDSLIFSAPTDKKNKDLCQDEVISDSVYRIYLVHLYGKSLLAYSNSFSGKLLFYQLHQEKITKQKYLLAFPSDITITLSVVDNLIVLSAINEKISMVFDVKKLRPESPLGPPQSILQQQEISTIRVRDIEKKQQESQIKKEQNQPEQQKKQSNRSLDDEQTEVDEVQKIQPVKVESDQESNEQFRVKDDQKKQVELEISQQQQQEPNQSQNQQKQTQEEKQFSDLFFVYDVQTLIQEIKQADSYFETFLVKMKWSTLQNKPKNNDEQSKIYEQSCNYQEDDLIVNYKEKQVYQFSLHLKYLPSTFDEEHEAFDGLLRRTNCKTALFEYLISLAKTNKLVIIFSNIFKSIFNIQIRAMTEKVGSSQVERLMNGTSVLHPSELQLHFFQVLAEDDNMNKQFLIEIMIEYIRQYNEVLREYRPQVPVQIQNLLIKLLIKNNRYVQLHFLIQYHALQDNIDFAKLLIDVSSKEQLSSRPLLSQHKPYEPAFKLGIDMLYRLQKHDELLEVLLKYGKFHDASLLLRRIPNLRMRLPPIQEGIRISDAKREDLIAFLEDAYKKQKTQFSIAEIKTL